MMDETKIYKQQLQKKYMKTEENRRTSDILGSFKTKICVKTLKYMGKELGTITTTTKSSISEPKIWKLIESMPPHIKIHMEKLAYPVYKIRELYRIIPMEYLTNNEIMIYTADNGHTTFTEVRHNDSELAKLIKKRGLEKEVFQDFLTQKR